MDNYLEVIVVVWVRNYEVNLGGWLCYGKEINLWEWLGIIYRIFKLE